MSDEWKRNCVNDESNESEAEAGATKESGAWAQLF